MPPPLSALLSQTLVAFIEEFDNEAEHRMPHRTTQHGARRGGGPWLVSMAMWSNCMRFLAPEGASVRELECRARSRTNWNGMIRWGYIYLQPAEGEGRSRPPHSALIVRPTQRGRLAQEVWEPLTEVVESRWRNRFGVAVVDQLLEALRLVVTQLDPALPDCLPILKYGLWSKPLNTSRCPDAGLDSDPGAMALPVLVSRALLAYALEFESESAVSLAVWANVLRLIEPQGTRVRNLSRLSGVSKPAIAMALTFLTDHGYAKVQRESAGSGLNIVLLTPAGMLAQETCSRLLSSVERRWLSRLGERPIEKLRNALLPLAGEGRAADSPLFAGLEPYPDGWRAQAARAEVLPQFPMVLHRGGFPDGS